MKRYREPKLSPEAERYLFELRSLPADEFQRRRVFGERRGRVADARRRGSVLSDRFQRKGTTKP